MMFRGCTALTALPRLPATTSESGCYEEMFEGCPKIKLSTTQSDQYPNEYRIPESGAGTGFDNFALYRMFYNTGGAFTGTPSANTTYYTANEVV
jgi:hypothetical protein